MADNSMLAHVAPKLTLQIENLATDALLYLLRRYPIGAKAFMTYVTNMGVLLPENLNFDTQLGVAGGAIPDLIGRDNNELVLLVEAKFWAPLTKNQPTIYLKHLPADRPGMVLFVAPYARFKTLWLELTQRCEAGGISIEITPNPDQEYHVAKVGVQTLMGLASWESLLSFLKQHLENSNDYQGAQEVWQLKGLCERLDYDAFHPLQEGDFTSISERQIKDLKSLLDDVVTVLVGQEVANIKRYKTTPGPDYYKRYMTLQGHRNWCAEYNAFYWNHFHLTPLWLTTTATPELLEALDPLRQGPTEKLFRYGRQLVIPLELPLQVERQEVIDSLVSQIEKIATLIKMNQ